MQLTPFLKNTLWATPLYFLSPIPFFFLAQYLEFDLGIKNILLGALGWWIAMILRLPIILIVKSKQIDLKVSNNITVGASGPIEESVRLVLLIILGINTNNAYAVGLGWAMIEVVYGLIQIVGLGVLDKKTDSKALEAKHLMKQMGMDKTLAAHTPYWGALERVSACAIHVGFSLLLVYSPYLIILTLPLHSFVNFYVVKMNKKSIKVSQMGLFVMGVIILIIGLILANLP